MQGSVHAKKAGKSVKGKESGLTIKQGQGTSKNGGPKKSMGSKSESILGRFGPLNVIDDSRLNTIKQVGGPFIVDKGGTYKKKEEAQNVNKKNLVVVFLNEDHEDIHMEEDLNMQDSSVQDGDRGGGVPNTSALGERRARERGKSPMEVTESASI